jgi:hypothetical protein
MNKWILYTQQCFAYSADLATLGGARKLVFLMLRGAKLVKFSKFVRISKKSIEI